MFSSIRNLDGSIRFETHVAPSRYSTEQARRALAALRPIISELRHRARGAADQGPERAVVDDHPHAGWSVGAEV